MGLKNTMDKKDFYFVENMLKRYPDMDLEIKRLEYELTLNNSEPDENIGGGRAQNKQSRVFENSVINVVDNKEIKKIALNQAIIKRMYNREDKIGKAILDEFYFSRYVKETLQSLALKMGSSRASIARRRTSIFKKLNEKLVR